MKDKVVLVTGGSSGIGKATALAFGRQGAKVVVADVNEELGKATVSQIEAFDAHATFVKCDVSKADQVEALVARTVSTYGKLDYSYNNAGIEGVNAIVSETTEENWDRVIATNLTGVWLCMKYEISEMLKNGGGAIVNCASVAGLVGLPWACAYVAAKHGVVGLTQTAALEYGGFNIRVNAVCPGPIQTPILDRTFSLMPEIKKRVIAETPVGRLGLPEEVACAVVWLCSDAATFVTGHSMTVDGGWTAK
jgi:NAD(P)-dependent dehydrogenase (short-subunit alcohol dehydrogenase family)